MKRVLALLLASVLMLAVCVSAASAEETGNEKAFYVYTGNTGKPLNVREEPNGSIIGSLEQGAKVRVISFINDTWAMIAYDITGSGTAETPAYVSRRYLIDIEPDQLVQKIEQEKEQYFGDVLMDITKEFESVIYVDRYKVAVRPARVTSWVDMRWVPSSTGPVIDQYRAGYELIVLAELEHYLQVEDPDNGAVGFIHKMFAARLQ